VSNLSNLSYILNQNLSLQVDQGNDQLGHALQCECEMSDMSGPTQTPVPYPSTHHTPLHPPMADNLRQLASHYMQHPNSMVDAVCVEQVSATGCKVTIALDVRIFESQ
jgi:hypothetical protein